MKEFTKEEVLKDRGLSVEEFAAVAKESGLSANLPDRMDRGDVMKLESDLFTAHRALAYSRGWPPRTDVANESQQWDCRDKTSGGYKEFATFGDAWRYLSSQPAVL
ncbi:MAG: hypothetical protein KIS61_09345 [Candidatus Eremiobacteraeota bacterium]|nr:hypothetical protein [Candidatus Eremiobacteraeota bacterium]